MLPVNVDTTTQQADAQREEQRRQTFRLWLGACLSTSLVFMPVILFQSAKDGSLRVALYAFITTIVLSIAAFFVREAGSQTTREHEIAFYLSFAAGVCTVIGLLATIGHYDPLASCYLFVISFIAAIFIRFLDTRRAAS